MWKADSIENRKAELHKELKEQVICIDTVCHNFLWESMEWYTEHSQMTDPEQILIGCTHTLCMRRKTVMGNGKDITERCMISMKYSNLSDIPHWAKWEYIYQVAKKERKVYKKRNDDFEVYDPCCTIAV